jgi:hypothetical protein
VLSWIQSHPALSAQRLAPMAVVLAFMGAAAAIGVFVASGNIMLIALSLGAIFGVLLLNAVGVVVWMILFGVLLVSGPLVLFFPAMGRIQWLFSILGFFLVAAAILYEGVNRDPHRPAVPGFVVVAVLFVVYAVCMLFVMAEDVGLATGAIKRYFQFWGLMFALTAVPFTPKTVRRWVVALLLIALAQLPFALYQKIQLVPMRVNMPNGIVPVDIVAGTFEANMMGAGSNSIMVLFLLIALATVLAALRDKVLRLPVGLLMMAILAAPLGLGETKIVLVLLPVAIFAIYADMARKRPFLFTLSMVITAGLVVALLYVYIALQPTDSRTGLSFQQRLEENIDYNFGRSGYSAGSALNRGNVVQFWWSRHGTQDLGGTLFGHGLGASHGWQSSESVGAMAEKYAGYGIGISALASLLWDVGILGTVLYFGMIAGGFVTARRLAARAPPGWDRAMLRGLSASALMLIVFNLANDAILIVPSLQVIACVMLGLIAWRARQVPLPDVRA